MSPGAIEASTVTSPGLFGRKTDKSKLWDEFATLHTALVDDIDRTTRTVVGEEFARVYDQQLAQLRQAGRTPHDFGDALDRRSCVLGSLALAATLGACSTAREPKTSSIKFLIEADSLVRSE